VTVWVDDAARGQSEGAVEALETIAAMGDWNLVSAKDTAQTAVQVARVALERFGGQSNLESPA
jgi:hypothetical protein